MFQKSALRCPVCGALLRTWHQKNVKFVKCPHCWSNILIADSGEKPSSKIGLGELNDDNGKEE